MGIPDRWLEYSKIGNVVEGTSFIPFKVPLHDRICENLPETARHTTRDIIEALPNVGLVINLTNTQKSTRYYDPNDWKSSNIDYKWIKVEGHVTPSQRLLVEFCHTVKQFMQTNPSKLIGIHCTHGLNRTGYFVCSYMVLMLSISPKEAMKRFSDARGYEIERQNYISSIILHDSNMDLRQKTNGMSNMTSESARGHREIETERYDNRRKRQFNETRYSNETRRHRNDGSSSSIRRDDSRSRYDWNNHSKRRDQRVDTNYRPRSDFSWRPSNLHAEHQSNDRYRSDRQRHISNERSSRPMERSWRSNRSPLRHRSRSNKNSSNRQNQY